MGNSDYKQPFICLTLHVSPVKIPAMNRDTTCLKSPRYLFAGPCSAESREQIFSVASFFKEWEKGQAGKACLTAIRAGAWKPRTRPGSFEGNGEKALEWMQQARQTYGIPFATEVANAHHVESCLKYGIGILWIGARSSANPFLMEEIGQALKGCRIPVWIKNPISPDLALWIGALERISRHSSGPIGGIHRGFGLYESAPYRNAPLWELAVEFKRECPDTPLLCDPSHIAGNRSLVQEVSQTGLDMEMDGFMLEVHPCPDAALSDARQQLDFEGFKQWFSRLVFRDRQGKSAQIEQIRCLLDEVDDELIQILARRMDLVRKLGLLKKEENLSVLQFGRWSSVMERCLESARKKDLDTDFVQRLLNCIHAEAIRLQKGILSEKEENASE